MRVRIDQENRSIVIAVPRQVPPVEMRASLHRMVDLALDGFENFAHFSELVAPDDPTPPGCKRDDTPWSLGAALVAHEAP